MRLFVYVVLVAFALDVVTSQVPDVYDFCDALLHNKRCQASCPQGGDSARIDNLQKMLAILFQKNPDDLVDLCGLGMKSGAIPDTSITATSQWDANWPGNKGRLDHKTHCWIAKPSEVGQYIQIDLGRPTVVTGVVTQGRPGSAQWVKSYKIACATTLDKLNWAMENGIEKVFIANTDFDSKVTNFLPSPMTCHYVRLYPQSWNSHISMRMELLGGSCVDFMP